MKRVATGIIAEGSRPDRSNLAFTNGVHRVRLKKRAKRVAHVVQAKSRVDFCVVLQGDLQNISRKHKEDGKTSRKEIKCEIQGHQPKETEVAHHVGSQDHVPI